MESSWVPSSVINEAVCCDLDIFLCYVKPSFLWEGFRPQAPDAFGLNPPSQLVLGYHWLAFVNQVHKTFKSPIH